MSDNSKLIEQIANSNHELYSRLAQGALHAHRVYTCPNCGMVNATHKFGEHPLCPYCNAPVTYVYKDDI